MGSSGSVDAECGKKWGGPGGCLGVARELSGGCPGIVRGLSGGCLGVVWGFATKVVA